MPGPVAACPARKFYEDYTAQPYPFDKLDLESIRQCASLREHIGPRAWSGWIETNDTRSPAIAPGAASATAGGQR